MTRHLAIALALAALVVLCDRFLDRPAAAWAHALAPGVVAAFQAVSLLGRSPPYLAGLAVLAPTLHFGLRRPLAARRALYALAVVALAGQVSRLGKWVAGRWRPAGLLAQPPRYGFDWFEIGHEHTSFPSGHTTTVFALACALTLLYPRRRLVVAGWAAAALVGASRVVVGAHFPGDVLAGAWLGTVVALGVFRLRWFRDLQAVAAPPIGDRECAPHRSTPLRKGYVVVIVDGSTKSR